MDNLLIPAALVLVLTNIAFALLANHWRRQARANDHGMMMQQLIETASACRAGYAGGYDEGRKHAIGLMYKIAVKADHEGRDVILALRDVDKQAETESIVQVPEAA
jgi:hypothetical protein